MKRDIPLDQSVALVRACQKLNCDTAEELFAMVEKRCAEAQAGRAVAGYMRVLMTGNLVPKATLKKITEAIRILERR